jgi:hypothetical protein
VRLTLLEEYHLSILVPRRLPDTVCVRIRRAVNAPWFRKELLRALKEILGTSRALQFARVRVSR